MTDWYYSRFSPSGEYSSLLERVVILKDGLDRLASIRAGLEGVASIRARLDKVVIIKDGLDRAMKRNVLPPPRQ